MNWLRRILGSRVSSDAFDGRFGQYICFATGPIVLVMAVYALAQPPITRREAVIGILCALNVCLLSVVVGLLLPLEHRLAPAAPSRDPSEPPA